MIKATKQKLMLALSYKNKMKETKKIGRPRGPQKEKITIYLPKGTRQRVKKIAERAGVKEGQLYTEAIRLQLDLD